MIQLLDGATMHGRKSKSITNVYRLFRKETNVRASFGLTT